MECPHCHTENEEGNQFCMNCGQPLTATAVGTATPLARSPGHLLGILTLRLVLVVFGLALIRTILVRLPFAQGIQIPNFPLSIEALITSAIYIIALLVLAAYGRSLIVLWPQTFPRYSDAGLFLAAVVYVGMLIAIYFAFSPIIVALGAGPDLLIWFEVLLLVIAVFLLARSGIALYRFIPVWLSTLRLTPPPPQAIGIACLNCGHLNSPGAKFCSNCANPLAKEA